MTIENFNICINEQGGTAVVSNTVNIHIFGNTLTTTALSPTVGYPQIDFYRPYKLPNNLLTSPNALISYLRNLGFTIVNGKSFDLRLGVPNYIDTTNANANIIYYTANANKINQLKTPNLQIKLTQDSIIVYSGTIIAKTGVFNANNSVYDSQIQLNGAPITALDITKPITATVSDLSGNIPNEALSDPIAVQLWWAIGNNNINLNGTIPNIYFTALPDAARTSLFAPLATPFILGIPNVVVGTTGDGSIEYNTLPINWALIPNNRLGNSKIKQGTTEAIIINKENENNALFIINFSNSTGTFNTTDPVELVLDDTQDIYSLIIQNNIDINIAAIPYEYTSTAKTDYAIAFQYKNTINQCGQSQFGFNGVQLSFSVTSIPFTIASSLPLSLDDKDIILSYYDYRPLINDIQLSNAGINASYSTFFGTNPTPYIGQKRWNLNLPVSSDQNTYIDVRLNGTADDIQDKGYNVAYIDNTGSVINAQSINSQITVNGVPSTEFSDEAISLKVLDIRKQLGAILTAFDIGNKNISSTLIGDLKGEIIAALNILANQGIISIERFNDTTKTLQITIDPTNSQRLIVNLNVFISQVLAGVDLFVNIFSNTQF